MIPALMAAAVGARVLFQWLSGPSFHERVTALLKATDMELFEFNGNRASYFVTHKGQRFAGASGMVEDDKIHCLINSGPRFDKGCTPRAVHNEIARLNRSLPRVSLKVGGDDKDCIIAFCEGKADVFTDALFREVHVEMADALLEVEKIS